MACSLCVLTCVFVCVAVACLHVLMLGVCFMCFFLCGSTKMGEKIARLGSFDVINQRDIDWLLLNMIK